MAGWVTILGSAAVVLTVFDLIANLRSLDTRERVQKAISEPPLDGMGIDTQQVLSVMHVLAMVAAGCATAAAILGWHVLRRNKQARLWLSVLAVPLFLAGLVTGGFLSSMVAVAVVMLWTRPARDWFDGRAPSPVLDGARQDRQDPDRQDPRPADRRRRPPRPAPTRASAARAATRAAPSRPRRTSSTGRTSPAARRTRPPPAAGRPPSSRRPSSARASRSSPPAPARSSRPA